MNVSEGALWFLNEVLPKSPDFAIYDFWSERDLGYIFELVRTGMLRIGVSRYVDEDNPIPASKFPDHQPTSYISINDLFPDDEKTADTPD